MTKIGVVTYPGTLDDVDAARAVRRAGAEPVALWHADADLHGVAAVILPGGFSYGDYVRAGAIASLAPVTRSIVDAAAQGLPVLGICNGFQVLCEAGLLPGALTRNRDGRFVARNQTLQVVNTQTAWTSQYETGEEILIPLKSGEGRYVANAAVLDELEAEGRVVFRYTGHSAGASFADGLGYNPNGSLRDIAGVASSNGRIVGLMPHPEHAIDSLCGPGEDGLPIFAGLVQSVAA
ncbi:phosphoribosylformylglycinamidine synthase subunit PurQ [Segniliparus rugosus]|uniref:Phosphoribosylformylglycinamidine synthase subunit PurQ n=1 Tax=Segniliparus rugosus (strain ATCC BAA-974 / DSM 45345 / CCUG 50838 / CIP 108380 / JCM 13579 / CDC 945) TaxID=679197 RepID=E5XV29_SEGRC|nr:phosphoribosylformylglycinamidine synthase subunit PurQ [Segniliparus rugosus]EFV11865.1 phosphoribosylformylglycinamidine synthase I [Segniliparus rugosus ATCC BAA-974]